MNCAEVYQDEIVSYNPITGEVVFVEDFSKTKMREEEKLEDLAGFYAWFKLSHGFYHGLYMTKKQVENHAKRYSKAYQYDLAKNRNTSRWSQDFVAMGKKTVIKLLLSRWGILSVDMQTAMREDQKVYDADGAGAYADNPQSDDTPYLEAASESDFIEAETTEATPEDEAEAKEMENLFGEE